MVAKLAGTGENFMKQLTGIFLSILFILCNPGSTVAMEKLVIAGTGDSQVLLRKLSVLFEKKYPAIDVVVPDSVGSGGGVKALIKETADLARTARPLKSKENTHGFTQVLFALSPIVFVSHPDLSGVDDITMDQVVQIYQGNIRNWNVMGGDDHKIYPVDREPGDSSRKILEAHLSSSYGKFKQITSVGKVFFTTTETAETIARNPYTIGYLPLSLALEKQLHIFSIDSVFARQPGSKPYPFMTTFYLVKPKDVGRTAEAFLSFIKGKEAKDLMLSLGTIPFVEPSRAD